MNRLLKHLMVFSLSLIFVSAFSQKEVPELWGHRVHDDAKVLKQSTLDSLESALAVYEDSTSNQVAILFISSLDGETIEEYSLRVAEKWQLGQKEKDNGVLFLASIDDHEMRIEVGEGLEGVLTDVICNRIIRNDVAPHFRRNDFDAGAKAGINSILKAIGGEYKAEDADGLTEMTWTARFFVGLFIFGILGIFTAVSLFSKGFMGWFLYLFLIPFYLLFPQVIIGPLATAVVLLFYVVGMPIAKIKIGRSEWGKKKMMTWSGGGSGSGWSSGGGGSSFSGGGGSFGGGGSSGSW